MVKPAKIEMVVPSDEMLVEAIRAIRADNATMGREKLKQKLQRQNKNWDLSNGGRFKQILSDYQLDTEEARKQKKISSVRQRDKSFNESVKLAFEEYRERERAFLLGLNENERYALDLQEPTQISRIHLRVLERINGKPLSKNDPRLHQRKSFKPKWYFAAHFRFHLQILMTLLGQKPVTLFSHKKFSGMVVLERMVEHCFVPVFRKYKLDTYGFSLQKITHPMFASASSGLQGAMVFADLRLKTEGLNEAVQEIFFAFHSGKVISEDDIAILLGHPMSEPQGMQAVRYRDMTEMNWLWKSIAKDSGDTGTEFFVPSLEYFSGDHAMCEKAAQLHFSRWAEAAKSVGVVLKFDMTSRPVVKTSRGRDRG